MTARIGGLNNSSNKVYLNVYDLHDNNDMLYPWGLGFYHSGVQVGRDEYTFASSAGIFTHGPKQAPGAKFRESIDMGEFKGTTRDLETIVQSLRPQFSGSDYHVLNKNCNSFANEFLLRLLGKEAPGYVNRMAYIGSFFSCLMPDQTANSAPVDNVPANQGSSFSSSGSVYRAGNNNNNRTTTTTRQPEAVHTPFTAPGRVLGGSNTESTSDLGLQDRRERIRAAAANRYSNNQ